MRSCRAVGRPDRPFEECEAWVDSRTFVYFDPPYRPLSNTAYFVSYSKGDFDDEDQRTLAGLFHSLHQREAHLLLSNSDPKNTVPDELTDRGDVQNAVAVILVIGKRVEMWQGSIQPKGWAQCVRNRGWVPLPRKAGRPGLAGSPAPG